MRIPYFIDNQSYGLAPEEIAMVEGW